MPLNGTIGLIILFVNLLPHLSFIVFVVVVYSSYNLYELIKKNNYQGFSLSLIRRFCNSIIKCLRLLYQENIIHCDLKPVRIFFLFPCKKKNNNQKVCDDTTQIWGICLWYQITSKCNQVHYSHFTGKCVIKATWQ